MDTKFINLYDLFHIYALRLIFQIWNLIGFISLHPEHNVTRLRVTISSGVHAFKIYKLVRPLVIY